MYFNEYQQLAERTARTANDTPEKRFINFSLTATGIWVVPEHRKGENLFGLARVH